MPGAHRRRRSPAFSILHLIAGLTGAAIVAFLLVQIWTAFAAVGSGERETLPGWIWIAIGTALLVGIGTTLAFRLMRR